MISFNLTIRAAATIFAATALASCDREKTDFSALPAVTQVTVTDYNTPKNAYLPIVWKISEAQKIARLSALVDAQSAGWRAMNSANISSKTGLEVKFSGPQIKRTFVVYARGFDNSYSTAPGNLWAMEGEYPNVSVPMVIKTLPDAAMEKMLAEIKAITQGVKPQPTPTPAPTPKPKPKTTSKRKAAK